jgi:hypothetical protein
MKNYIIICLTIVLFLSLIYSSYSSKDNLSLMSDYPEVHINGNKEPCYTIPTDFPKGTAEPTIASSLPPWATPTGTPHT